MSMETVAVPAPNGTYVGRRDPETGGCAFLGIPFGHARRWQRAEDVTTTTSDRISALEYGPAPWQNPGEGGLTGPAGYAGDCLNLNLYAADTAGAGKAVMVWIYGGAQIAGSNIGARPAIAGMEPLSYDGSRLTLENPEILLVVPNYRVGLWGSVDLSVLPDAGPEYRYSSNLARLDILQCLKWVRENIAAFGGDPNNVTLFGQSAGSCNITALMLMEQANGLFQKVICESSFAADISLTRKEDARTVSRAILETAGCRTLLDALEKPDRELLAAQQKVAAASMGGSSAFSHIESKLFAPVIDGVTIPEDYWERLLTGKCGTAAFLGGTNQGEYDQQYAAMPEQGRTESARAFTVSQNWGKLDPERGTAPWVTDRYCAQEGRTPLEACMDLKADLYLRMGAILYAAACAGRGNAYLYLLRLPRPDGRRFGHGEEIPILFCHDRQTPARLQKQIRDRWCAFALTGEPNCAGLPERWEPFGENWDTLVIGEKTAMVPGWRAADARLLLPLLREYGDWLQ